MPFSTKFTFFWSVSWSLKHLKLNVQEVLCKFIAINSICWLYRQDSIHHLGWNLLQSILGLLHVNNLMGLGAHVIFPKEFFIQTAKYVVTNLYGYIFVYNESCNRGLMLFWTLRTIKCTHLSVTQLESEVSFSISSWRNLYFWVNYPFIHLNLEFRTWMMSTCYCN